MGWSNRIPLNQMPDALTMMQAYTLTRWICGWCGTFDRGTARGLLPAISCTSCGRSVTFVASIHGMTITALPFFTQPRQPQPDNDGPMKPRNGNHRNGKSTGRPRKTTLPIVPALPNPSAVRLPGDRNTVKR